MQFTKITSFIVLISLISLPILSQDTSWMKYNANPAYPFGQKNPEAPEQLNNFAPMIGTCHCKSLRRQPDGNWADTTQLIWTFKYILNGTAIQDETWTESVYATSIRQYQQDSARWKVSYNSYPSVTLNANTWIGAKVHDQIVLDMPQTAANGLEGISRLTFYDIRTDGFNWKGEWIQEENKINYPFWYIWCTKVMDP